MNIINQQSIIVNPHIVPFLPQDSINIPCDTVAERATIAQGKIDLLLYQKLGSGQISDILDGEKDDNFFKTKDFKIVCKEHKKILGESHNLRHWIKEQKQDFQASIGHAIKLMEIEVQQQRDYNKSMNNSAKESTSSGKLAELPTFNPSRKSEVISSLQSQLKQVENISESLHQYRVLFPFASVFKNTDASGINDCFDCPHALQFMSGYGECAKLFCPNYSNLKIHLNQQKLPTLIEIFASQEGVEVKDGYKILIDRFGINPDEPDTLQGNGDWHQVKNISNMTTCLLSFKHIPLYGPTNNLLGYWAIGYTDNGKQIVPVTAWTFGGSHAEYFFQVPFKKPTPLFNWNLIVHNPGAEIFLTDSVEMAAIATNSNSSVIWTSWLGAASDVNWQILKQRKIKYVLIQHSGYSMKEIYKTAIIACSQLKDVEGIDIELIEIEGI